MKYILLFIIIYWIGRRVLRIFAIVNNDRPSSGPDYNSTEPTKKARKEVQGEYVDFEEIE